MQKTAVVHGSKVHAEEMLHIDKGFKYAMAYRNHYEEYNRKVIKFVARNINSLT